MGQIVSGAAKPKRCNINQLSQLGTPAAGEYILVSSDNSMNATGQGNFDCYIEGDGRTAATALELKSLVDDGIFDISAYHATGDVLAKYADLSAALGANGANIPQSIRKGGVSVKFVRSSDNKYVQYRLMSDEFTTDTTQWAIDDAGVYVENPEFIDVKTDAEGKILWAIKTDGSIYWGAGVPQQIIDYVTEKIEELSLNEYDDIVTFLGNLIEGDTLATLLNAKANAADVITALDSKVDKITGKGLIQNEVSEILTVIEDPEERNEIITDSEGKIISYRDSDGVKYENVGFYTKELSAKRATINEANINTLNLTQEGKSLLKEELGIDNKVDIDSEFSVNLINDNATILPNTFMYNNGALLTNENYFTLDYFEVEPGACYSTSFEFGNFRKVCCFNSSKQFIAGGFFENTKVFTTPEECKYVRISGSNNNKDYFMLAKNYKPVAFSKYNEIQGYLNHDNYTDDVVKHIKDIVLKEWSELQFGLFLHWGVYSAWAGKYDGVDIDGNEVHITDGTEWMWWRYKIPKATYKAKAADFSSTGWNPDEICRLAKSVGMKYIVLTLRHHEGFSLIPTSYCEWDIRSSSASEDVVMQLKEACDRHHIKFCVYISALLDWNDFGGFGQEQWNNSVDPYTRAQHVAFTSEQADYCRQVYETYKPYLIWFDGGGYIVQSGEVRNTFIKKQNAFFPLIITNGRGSIPYGDWEDVENNYADNPNTDTKYERCNHIRGWGYNEANDTPTMINNLYDRIWDMTEAMGRGFNYLLNIPPKGDGSISDNYKNWMKKLAQFCQKYTFFNGAKRLFNSCQPSWGRPLYIGNSIYMIILPNGNSSFYVDSIDTTNISGVHVYNINTPDSVDNFEIVSDDRLLLKNIPTTSDDYFVIVRLDFNGDVFCGDYNIISDSISTLSIVRVEYTEWADYSTGIKYKTKVYSIGSDNSLSMTKFKYTGMSGVKTFDFNIDNVDGNPTTTITLKDMTANTSNDYTLNNSTVQNVSLVENHMYELYIAKEGTGRYSINNSIEIL